MPTKHCSFANCTSDSRYPKEKVFFIPFVKPRIDKVRCDKWIHATRRTDLTKEKIKKYTYVCSKHFIGGKGPTEENPDPVSATISKIPTARKKRRPSTFKIDSVCTTLQKQNKSQDVHPICFISIQQNNIERTPLKDTSVDELAEPKAEPQSSYEEQINKSVADADSVGELAEVKAEPQSSYEGQINKSVADADSVYELVEVNAEPQSSYEEQINKSVADADSVGELVEVKAEPQSSYEEQINKSVADAESQTCIEVESIYVKKLQNEIQNLRKKLCTSTLSYEMCIEDCKKFKFYTGLMPEDFDIVWNFLGPPTKSSLIIWHSRSQLHERITLKQFKALSLKNQLFLTLVRLRSGFLLYDLSCRFGLSVSYVSKITTTWIQFMHHKFKQLNHFPSATDISKNLPLTFKKLKNFKVVIVALNEICKNRKTLVN